MLTGSVISILRSRLQPKEANWDRLRELTRKRVEQLQTAGRRFDWLEVEYWWQLEAFRFLKSRSRAISLIDDSTEKSSWTRCRTWCCIRSPPALPNHEMKSRRFLLGDTVGLVTARSEIVRRRSTGSCLAYGESRHDLTSITQSGNRIGGTTLLLAPPCHRKVIMSSLSKVEMSS